MSELKLERSYPVSSAELFAYVTEPDNLIKWWGPEGSSATDVELDLRRVGPWRLVLQTPRGPFTMKGSVLSVIPPEMVEFTMNVPGADTDSVVRFDIAGDDRGGSRLTLTQSSITEEMVAMGKQGWGSTLGRLDKLITTRRNAA